MSVLDDQSIVDKLPKEVARRIANSSCHISWWRQILPYYNRRLCIEQTFQGVIHSQKDLLCGRLYLDFCCLLSYNTAVVHNETSSCFVFFRVNFFSIAGTTSSGKSTIVNGLLGFNLLPTGHNATTSALCEIKWGATKTAVVHLKTFTDSDGDEKFEPEVRPLSLENEDNRKELASYISCDRDEKASVRLCHKVEIFWPLPFLKVGSLIRLYIYTFLSCDDARSSLSSIVQAFLRPTNCLPLRGN